MSELRRIRGIGPKTAELLADRGLDTIQKLAKAHPDDVAGIPGGRTFIVRAREILGGVSWEPVRQKVRSGTGEGVSEVYELKVTVTDVPQGPQTWHPLSPYAGHPVDEAVLEAVAALQREDLKAGRAPIMVSHVMTFRDYGDRVVLSCEPGGKRIYHRG